MNKLFTPKSISMQDMYFISTTDKAYINTLETEMDRIFDEVAKEISLACQFIEKVA